LAGLPVPANGRKVHFPAEAGHGGGSPEAGKKIVDGCARCSVHSHPLSLARIADVLCQVLLLARYHKIDIVEEIRGK